MAVSTAPSLKPPPLLVLLTDGRVHCGESLAQALGVTRAAVWKGIGRLRATGIEVESVARRGYRLPLAVELLDGAAIRAGLRAECLQRLRGLEVLFETDSTNTRLLAAAPPPHGCGDVLLTELQLAGRGRRGRQWLAPFGGSLVLSLAWSFTDAALASPALSLCVGVAVARGLARVGAEGIGLKWPNDLWFEDRKVGGVLIELRAEACGPAHAVIGVGLNVSLSSATSADIRDLGAQPAAIAEACAMPPSRNFIAAAIIDELLSMLAGFERGGFAAFRDAWTALDALRDRPARVLMGDRTLVGTARGVDVNGALRLERAGQIEEFVSGEVSLRLGGDDI